VDDWHQRLASTWHWAVAAPGFALTEQVVQILRMLAIAAVTWAAIEMIQVGRSVAVMQAQIVAINEELRRLTTVAELRAAGTVGRGEFEREVEAMQKRLDDLAVRVDRHAQALANLHKPRP